MITGQIRNWIYVSYFLALEWFFRQGFAKDTLIKETSKVYIYRNQFLLPLGEKTLRFLFKVDYFDGHKTVHQNQSYISTFSVKYEFEANFGKKESL